jgi:sulfonate transport system permease protein
MRVVSDRAWRRSRGLVGRGWLRLVSPVAVIGIWQLLSATGILPPSRLASPVSIAHTAYNLVVTDSPAYGTLQGSLLVSSERWGIGFSIGVVVAVIIAILSGLSRIGEYALDPVMNALRSVPLLGLLPLFIVWFGIGDLPKDLIVLLGALFPMYINTFAGIRSVDPKLGELGQVLGLSRWELVWHVVLPGALPQALTGLRLSVIGSLLALVVGEQINANAGLGFMMNQAETFLANNVIVVALLVYALLGVIADSGEGLVGTRGVRPAGVAAVRGKRDRPQDGDRRGPVDERHVGMPGVRLAAAGLGV